MNQKTPEYPVSIDHTEIAHFVQFCSFRDTNFTKCSKTKHQAFKCDFRWENRMNCDQIIIGNNHKKFQMPKVSPIVRTYPSLRDVLGI